MTKAWCVGVSIVASAFLLSPASAQRMKEPLQFFEGATVSESKVQILFRKAFSSRSEGRGRINSDGSLDLVQKVEEDGRSFQRRWHIKPVGPGRYAGTMSEATSQVTIDEVGDRYRFRFGMKGNVKVEQWLTPRADGKSAASETIIRKHGVVVGRSKGTIRKI